jgi:hypothetical protein
MKFKARKSFLRHGGGAQLSMKDEECGASCIQKKGAGWKKSLR